MALDGIFLCLLVQETKAVINTRIEKIYQPSRDELVLLLRSATLNRRLFISARSGFSRMQIVDNSPDNPAEPPTFCKLLRKHIGGAKITDIEQLGLDRVVFIRLAAYNEMGDRISPYLAVELLSNRANIILVGDDGRIIDCVHRSDIENGGRLLQPGARYLPPDSSDKLNPLLSSAQDLAKAVTGTRVPLGSAFMTCLDGVSPLVSRELAHKTGIDPDSLASECPSAAIKEVLEDFKAVISSEYRPCLIIKDGLPFDFCYMPITQYKNAVSCTPSEGFNALLGEYYLKREQAARIKAASQDILKLLTNIKNRIERRMSARMNELLKSRDREQLRIFGELLKANLYLVQKGADSVSLQNYYDPEFKEITIPLNPALSPAANAGKYFKEYKKSHTAENTLKGLIDADKEELSYIESVLDNLSRAEGIKDLTDIKEELIEAGYLRTLNRRKAASVKISPKEYADPSGFKISVGRNNRENDILTLKTAGKEDIWLHTKDTHGSHVIIFTEGKEVPEETLVFAARLAAAHSKAKESDNVAVDYTLAKYVKKPSGAKPGMVIYSHNKTLFVDPSIKL